MPRRTAPGYKPEGDEGAGIVATRQGRPSPPGRRSGLINRRPRPRGFLVTGSTRTPLLFFTSARKKCKAPGRKLLLDNILQTTKSFLGTTKFFLVARLAAMFLRAGA